jgi:hypothetical protein
MRKKVIGGTENKDKEYIKGPALIDFKVLTILKLQITLVHRRPLPVETTT